MDDNENVHNQICNAEDIGVVCFSFSPGEELHHTTDSQQLVDANLWVVKAKVEIEDVSGKHGDNIKMKLEASGVAILEELLIFYQEALFKVAYVQRSRSSWVKEKKKGWNKIIVKWSLFNCNTIP